MNDNATSVTTYYALVNAQHTSPYDDEVFRPGKNCIFELFGGHYRSSDEDCTTEGYYFSDESHILNWLDTRTEHPFRWIVRLHLLPLSTVTSAYCREYTYRTDVCVVEDSTLLVDWVCARLPHILTQSGYAIQFVENPTPINCLCAVQTHGRALEFIPDTLKTEDMCRAAVQQNGESLEFVPKMYLTHEICMSAVQTHGWTLEYVPDTLKTEDMCRVAVQQSVYALEFVPKMYHKNIFITKKDDILTSLDDPSSFSR